MATDEKKAYIARIKALKKKEKQGTATSSELWELTDYYNESAKKFQVATFVVVSVNILLILAWLVVKLVLFAN